MPAPHPNELRVQVLSYWALGIQPPDIAKMLQINVRTIWDMIQKGQDRGYNPAQSMRVKLEYVEDGKRSGRPKEISEATDMAVLASVKQDRNGREKSSEILAFEAETAYQHKKSEVEIAALNAELEPILREEWEIETRLKRLHLRGVPGRVPTWRFTEKTGKLVRKSKGGVDWWRYQQEILLPHLIPFAKACKIERPDTKVLEDGAPAHKHHAQRRIYSIHEIEKIFDWPGNSPDLNAIEPCWMWMKKRTTSRGAPRDKKTGKTAWIKAWNELPQEKIQGWIERLIRHIQEVIQHDGGNEYKEGRTDHDARSWKGRRIKGQLSARQDLSPDP
ncbi:hypothetical protein AN2628.2 [Aspergillus nidulans FGSC A4]|uniref:Tc1-like transposase DDE domain-containing protein n=1 Tax=Emericella nidulans (strain FGSC A4 / ATCC 38163 / CBS 112.46 / NRRL 194 / M139) TaxID=227321 RepID=Q5BA02_EMENI|nr:hypothetical protein [Aspergillus nidulans FGSC A4]EAA62975.1 hypothetical protein AN2628.2 [Aspergillus nidulans FGSC A4]CBF84331.1 TPA: conserved hypothetical protein [Aspergillus nidulans FGSC A4]|eukprot:XP_660232.1 hypothetical protein AN2628.2 [Aspergillus nidulans FGSC A4]